MSAAVVPADVSILIVDDEPANVRLVERALQKGGFENLRSTTDPRRVLPLCQEDTPDLLVLDLHMPSLDGYQVMSQLRSGFSKERYLPILVLTADVSEPTKQRALSSGATDFLTKPFSVTEAILRARNLLETRLLYRDLEERVRERTHELELARVEILERLTQAVEFRDDDTGQHTKRVGEIAAGIARILGLPEGQVELIRRAAPLHDAGKVGIPDAVLLKPGRLTPAELETMREHAVLGARILSGGASELMRTAEQIALGHHERWDGGGYPRGLAGNRIPLVARIVAVADVFDALSHDRPYRPAWPRARVLAEIEAGSGTQFDPAVVQAFIRYCDREGD